MPRESSKSREWEKERRNRLNEAFNSLCKLLPSYDPANNISKIEILRNATFYIEELQGKVKGLLDTESAASTTTTTKKVVDGKEIKQLQDKIKRLINKNEQLCGLLREAKISIPNGCAALRKFRSPLYWSNKITSEQAKHLRKKELEKENNVKKCRKLTVSGKVNKNITTTPKHRKAILTRTDSKKGGDKKRKTTKHVNPSKCLIVLSQPSISQPCYVITNSPSNGLIRNTSTVITNSSLLSTPLVSSNTKTQKATTPLSALGPGTLILANGTILPVLPQPGVLPVAPQILTNPLPLNPRPNNPSIILVPKTSLNNIIHNPNNNNNKLISSGTKTLARIKPKYCMTKTTQINKVPIPALTSRYSNNDLVLKKTETKINNNNNNNSNSKNKVEEKDVGGTKKIDEAGDKERNETGGEKRKLDSAKPVEEKVEEVKRQKLDDCTEKQNDKNKNENETDTTINSTTIDVPTSTPDNLETTPTPISIENKTSTESIVDETISISTTEANLEKPLPASEVIEKITETKTDMEPKKSPELTMNHSELSNDIFASLQVPTGCQNPESTSPTAAFLLAFPLVSSLTGVKVAEVAEEDNNESQRGSPTLLQIGTMDATKPTQSESLTPSLLNLDNLSFFSSKDICGGFYGSFDTVVTTTVTSVNKTIINSGKVDTGNIQTQNSKTTKYDYQQQQQQQNKTNIQCNPNNTGFDNRNILGDIGPLVNYEIKKASNDKNLENKNCNHNYQPPHSHSHSQHQQQQQQQHHHHHQQSNKNNFHCNNFNESSSKAAATSVIKSYPDPLYTNSNNYNYSYASDNNFNQNYYKNITKNDNRNYYSLNYENYNDYKKGDGGAHFSGHFYNNIQNSNKDKFTNNNNNNNTGVTKSKNPSQNRAPINWMTTPDNRIQNSVDYVLPQFTKETDFSYNSIYPPPPPPPSNTFVTNTQTSYFNSNPVYPNSNNDLINSQENRKNLDLPLVPPPPPPPPVNTYHQRNEMEDNQFTWSPTKMPQFLDPSHNFVSSTLPTLVGDLALGNSLGFCGEAKEKCQPQQQQKKETSSGSNRRVKNYDGHNQSGNFLSVSQLVDHNKNEGVPARTTARRNSGNRSKSKSQTQQQQQQQKSSQRVKHQDKDITSYNKIDSKLKQINSFGNDLFCDPNKTSGVAPKNTSSNYSAEALIGHQMQTGDNKSRQQNYTAPPPPPPNKTIPVPFLHDNIIPYFPPVDLPQDNNYMQQNQNYQSGSFGHHNFPSTFHNNTTYTPNTFIPTSTTITSTYLSSNNFMHEMSSNHDYSDNLTLFPTNKEKSISKNVNNLGGGGGGRGTSKDQQQSISVPANMNPKKSKKKHGNESSNLPGFDFPFLSMPGSINSPILPDDFHTHSTFLQPPTPQLYPCKNPLYSKQNDLASGSLLALPSVPGTRGGIQHPEISPSLNNAGTSLTNFNLSTIFPEINKGALSDPYVEPRIKEHSNRNYSSTAQVSFNDKPTFSFSYINSTTSQPYNNNNHQ